MNYSLYIGIENFADSRIGDVSFAVADAQAVATAFGELGFDKNQRMTLSNSEATRTRVEYEIQQILKCALEDDVVLIFFSGHGASISGQSYLVCHDTMEKGIPTTGLPIKTVFNLMENTRSQKVMLLLDCCHAGLQFPKGDKSLIARMTDTEIRDFFAGSAYRIAFASCADSEKSYWADVLGHGVWTHVLLQALTGQARHILESGRYLTAAHLQDYLHKQVPVVLRETKADKVTQTPQMYGSLSNNFLIGDLAPLLAKTVKGMEEIGPIVKDVSFRNNSTGRVRDLPGFQKGHKVYDDYTAATQAFVARVGAPQVEERANELHKSIKSAFGYLRQDCRLDTDGSSATIKAKDFDVDVAISQSEEDPSEYIETTEIYNFRDANIIMEDRFNELFANEVSTLRIRFTSPKKVTEFIDAVERAADSRISVDYPADYSNCTFSIEGIDAEFVLRPKSLSIRLPGAEPREMVKALLHASKVTLLDAANFALLGPPSKA